jgi:RimJ/RimL family protein N-acetyltransferase
LAIEVIEDQQWKHIGNLGAKVDQKNKIADLSIIIGDKNNWNKGFGTISWSMASLSLINLLNLRFVTAGTMQVNKPMLSIFRKSGMQIEATLPNRFLFEGDEVGLIIASGDRKTFENFLSNNDR